MKTCRYSFDLLVVLGHVLITCSYSDQFIRILCMKFLCNIIVKFTKWNIESLEVVKLELLNNNRIILNKVLLTHCNISNNNKQADISQTAAYRA